MVRERTTTFHRTRIDLTWPAGPIEAYLLACGIPIRGFCVNAVSQSPTGPIERLARGRIYNLDDWFVLGDAFVDDPLRNFGVHKMFILMRVAFLLSIDNVPPARIIWPSGFHDPQLEKKADKFWMRAVQPHELAQAPAEVLALAAESQNHSTVTPTGLWCIDEGCEHDLLQRAAQLRGLHKLWYRHNSSYAVEVPLKFTDAAAACLDMVDPN